MIKNVITSVFAVMCAAGIAGTAAATTPDVQRTMTAQTVVFSPAHLTYDAEKVMGVLRQRIGDPGLLEKVSHKLSVMSENRLRLVVKLSDRVADRAPTAETDIAFLLLTTLIIFS